MCVHLVHAWVGSFYTQELTQEVVCVCVCVCVCVLHMTCCVLYAWYARKCLQVYIHIDAQTWNLQAHGAIRPSCVDAIMYILVHIHPHDDNVRTHLHFFYMYMYKCSVHQCIL